MNSVTVARTILMIVTALVIVVYYVPLGHMDYENNWREASYGFSVAPTSPVLVEVTNPQLIADGIRPGDRLQTTVYSLENSRALFPRPGDRMTLHFLTKNGAKTERFTAQRD